MANLIKDNSTKNKINNMSFEVKRPKPSKQLRKALKEAEKIEKHPEIYKAYSNIEELRKALLSDD